MQYKRDIKFLIYQLLFVMALSGLTFLAEYYIPQFVTPYWSILILFLFIMNTIVYFATMYVRDKNDMGKFTNFYMGITVLKLFVYIAFLIAYILIFPEDKKASIITFLAYYLCFSIFETYILTKK